MSDDLGVNAAINVLDKAGEVGKPLQDTLFEPETDADAQDQAVIKRGRGRPLGSSNKKTAEIAEYIQSRYGDPLVNLAEIANLSDAELRKMGVKWSEVARLRVQCWSTIAPFVHARKTELKTDGMAPLSIVINDFQPSNDDADAQIVEVIDAVQNDNENNDLDQGIVSDLEHESLEKQSKDKGNQ